MNVRFVSALATAALAAALVCGCSSSSGPSENEPLGYPDISGLVAFYPFNGNLEDSSPNGHDAIGTDGILYVDDRNGASESAVYISGRTDTIIVADRGAFDFDGGFTVGGWVKAGLENLAYNCFIDKGYASGGWAIGTSGGAEPGIKPLRFYVANHSYDFVAEDAIPVGLDTWVHFACSFDDDTDVARLYVNGAFARADTYAVDMSASGLDLYIGTSNWGDAYRGALDEIAVFDRVLSDGDVIELFNFE